MVVPSDRSGIEVSDAGAIAHFLFSIQARLFFRQDM